MIELAQLKAFCAVVEKKSFTRAGEAVHRTQSTVSAQIALLEKAYGVTLLNRLQKEVVPTESGEILYGYAKRILRLVDESRDKILKLKRIVKGDLIIGASTIPGNYILPEILRDFKKKYPEVNISLQISNSKDVIGKILDRRLEIGAVGERIRDNRLEYTDLATERIVLVVSPNHKWARMRNVSLDDLRREPFISREEGSGTRATVEEALKRKGTRALNIAMEVGSTEAVKETVKAGFGISFISEQAIKDGSLKEVKIKELDIIRNFYMVFLKSGIKKHAVQSLIDFTKEKQGSISKKT